MFFVQILKKSFFPHRIDRRWWFQLKKWFHIKKKERRFFKFITSEINKNKLEFRERPHRIQKPNNDQNLFCRFQSCCWTVLQKMKLKDQDILIFWHLQIFYVKNQAIRFVENVLEPNFNNQTVKLFEITQPICLNRLK